MPGKSAGVATAQAAPARLGALDSAEPLLVVVQPLEKSGATLCHGDHHAYATSPWSGTASACHWQQ